MARTARSRSRTLRVQDSGSLTRTRKSNGSVTVTNASGGTLASETTNDSIGTPWLDSDFDSTKYMIPNVSLSGSYADSIYNNVADNVPLNLSARQRLGTPWLVSAFGSHPSPLSASTLGAMAVASMNPNSPAVDLPVAIFELRELPGLLRDAGAINRKLPRAKGSAKANLMAQFGIAPIIRDVLTLLDFATEVQKREKLLNDMSRGYKRFKRELTTEEWTRGPITLTTPYAITTGIGAVSCSFSYRAKRRYWFTARAKLLNPPSVRDLQDQAFWSLLGLDGPHIDQLWQALPWSWLVDWFFTTDTLLKAYRRGIPWTWEGINVMHTTKYYTSGTIGPTAAGLQASIPNPNGSGTVLYRKPVTGYALPEFRIPFLTGKQLSILGSLALLRI